MLSEVPLLVKIAARKFDYITAYSISLMPAF